MPPRPSKSSASSSAASTPESKDGNSEEEEVDDDEDDEDRGAGASGVSSLSSQLWGPERTVEVSWAKQQKKIQKIYSNIKLLFKIQNFPYHFTR